VRLATTALRAGRSFLDLALDAVFGQAAVGAASAAQVASSEPTTGTDTAATRCRCLGCAPPLSAKPISSVAGRPARFPASFGAFGGKHGRRPPGSSSLASHVDLAAGCWLDPGPFGCLGTGLGYA
jgi:hypothetical protein